MPHDNELYDAANYAMRHSKTLAALAALVVLPLLLQGLWLAPLAGRYLSKTSGRRVHFDSLRVGLSGRLQPLLHVRGAQIANAPWADTTQPMAVIGEGSFEFTWGSLLTTPTLIARLELHNANVDLERRADGLRNWRLLVPTDRGPGRYRVLALDAHQSSVRFAHQGFALDLYIQASANTDPASKQALPSRYDFAGAYQDIPFKGSAATDGGLTFYDTGRRFAVQADAEAGGARLTVAGHAGDVLGARSVDADVELAGSSLAPFASLIGQRGKGSRSFGLKAHFKGDEKDYSASGLRAHLGASDVSGAARYAIQEKATLLHAELQSELLDLDDLTWLKGSGAKPDASAAPAQPRNDGPQGLRMELAYSAAHLRSAQFAALQSLRLRATAKGEVLALPEFDLGLAGGHAKGQLQIDERNRAARRLAGKVSWQGIQLAALMPAQQTDHQVSGVLRGSASLESAGDSLDALAKAMAGSATLSISGGKISSALDARIGLQGGRVLRTLIGGSQLIPIDCASLALAMQNGRGSIRSLVLDTPFAHTTGTGSIDLPGQTLNLLLSSEARQNALLVLDKSVQLQGPWRKPVVTLTDRAAPAKASCEGG